MHRTTIHTVREEEGWFWPYVDNWVLVYPNDIREAIENVPENVIQDLLRLYMGVL